MDLQTALKLQKLRKDHGLSQEELADKLGVSRQAVSKWERAEASPDTDNLICLAKLYKTSLDELLGIEKSQTDFLEGDVKGEDEGSSHNVFPDVSAVKSADDDDEDDEEEDEEEDDSPSSGIGRAIHAVTPILSAIVFLLLGGIWGLWHPGWIVFFSIPLVPTLIAAIERKKFCAFAYPVFVTAVYLCLGCIWGLWHPLWILFTTIPLYYVFFGFIDKKNRSK